MEALLAAPTRPDAVFAVSDTLAAGALRAIEQAGLRVPDDIAVAGFDGRPVVVDAKLDGIRIVALQKEHGLDQIAASPFADRIERAARDAGVDRGEEQLEDAEDAEHDRIGVRSWRDAAHDPVCRCHCSPQLRRAGLRGSHAEQLAYPADLYLEGSDQHRGWFHSSLLTGSMLDGRAPYKALLTHGFVVDGQGRKMSKSVGNIVAPQTVANKMGAEIIRLWVASTDYSGDLGIDDKILARVVDAYRRIRNTLRFLLANTSDFDASKDAVAYGEMLEIDQFALARSAQLQQEILAHYKVYEFHPVVAKIQLFCSEDLGGFYLDVLKDRLYTSAPKSLARRSAQTALYQITQALLRWMSPFLSFTAEEAWKIVGHSESIFLEKFTELPAGDEGLLAKWTRLCEIRNLVNKDIEVVRTTGAVGSSLQAEVTLTAEPEDLALLQSLKDDLKFVFITSAATAVAGDALTTTVKASEHAKCERCWHYREDVGVNPEHPSICGRCDSNLHGTGELRSKA